MMTTWAERGQRNFPTISSGKSRVTRGRQCNASSPWLQAGLRLPSTWPFRLPSWEGGCSPFACAVRSHPNCVLGKWRISKPWSVTGESNKVIPNGFSRPCRNWASQGPSRQQMTSSGVDIRTRLAGGRKDAPRVHLHLGIFAHPPHQTALSSRTFAGRDRRGSFTRAD